MEEPAPQRAWFVIQSRYRYRQIGEPVVYNDHILLYSQKYNSYLHASETYLLNQIQRASPQSQYRLKSPIRRPDPETVYRRFEANICSNFYKWQVMNYRQVETDETAMDKFIFSGDVISLKHAETTGRLCYDEISHKKNGSIFARIYKGQDE